jgi:type I restriction enzyme S subunit
MSELPPGWRRVPLGELLSELKNGIFVSRPGTEETDRPILRISAVRPMSLRMEDVRYVPATAEVRNEASAHVDAGDLLFTRYSGNPEYVGACALVRQHVPGLLYPDKLIRARVRRDVVDPSYLEAAMAAPATRTQVRRRVKTTAGQVGIAGSDLRSIPIPLAPYSEQRHIVAAIEKEFTCIDAGGAALQRVRQKLKRMRAVVLLTAVTGRLLPQDRSEGTGATRLTEVEVGQQASKRSSRARPNLVTDLPELPDNWTTAKWRRIGRSQNGRAFPSKDYSSQGVKLLRPGNLHVSGQVAWTPENTRCLPTRYADEFPTYMIGPNELVMNLTAQSLRDEFLGRVCITGTDGGMLLNQRIARLTPIAVNPRYAFWVLKSPLFRRFVDQLNTGSLIQHMFTSQLDEFVFPIPPLLEQERIVAAVDECMSRIDATEEMVAAAECRGDTLRTAILAAAFSGRLVPDGARDEPDTALPRLVDPDTPGLSGDGATPRIARGARVTA